MTTAARWDAKIRKTDTCWLWTGCTQPNGYGRFRSDGRIWLAHRFAWEFYRGPIGPDLHIDHLCKVRACVNPDHLEPVSQLVNNHRAAPTPTHCKNGHPRTAENGYIYEPRGLWRCRICRRVERREMHRRRRLRMGAGLGVEPSRRGY